MFLTCDSCGWYWRTKKEVAPKLCPECGQDWRKPTLKQRFAAAITAWKLGKVPGVRSTIGQPKQAQQAKATEPGPVSLLNDAVGGVAPSPAPATNPHQESLL